MKTQEVSSVNECPICQQQFTPTRGGMRAQVYCSPDCRAEASRRRKATPRTPPAPSMFRHCGQLIGSGTTAAVHNYMMEQALEGRWVTPHDVIDGTGTTAPTTFFSDINYRLPEGARIMKRWNKERGRRGCWEYKLCQTTVEGEARKQ